MNEKLRAKYLEAVRMATEIHQTALANNDAWRGIEIPYAELARRNFIAITAAKIFDEIKDREDECNFPG